MKIKINSMNNESNPSDDEIRSYMNFDQVVEAARKQSRKQKLHRIWIALPVIVVLILAWYLTTNRNDISPQTIANGDAERINAQTIETTPGTVKDQPDQPEELKSNSDEASPDKQAHIPGAHSSDKGNAKRGNPQLPDSGKMATTNDRKVQSGEPSAVNDKEQSQPDIYVQAEPQNGYAHLYKYFGENLKYPKEAIKDSIEGVETVSFTIDEQGHPANVAITHSLGKSFDNEAIRLIGAMPLWTPAMLNGRPVASQLSLPLTFEIKRTQKN
ncbi:TonB family protein [Chryseolinea sp. T2]|uniref:energy transducer TonB n=1 Tax=Chryseolinea sp. T2 TaxID=3129255 RepID=UPI003077C358